MAERPDSPRTVTPVIKWILLLAAVATEVSASMSLKAALDRPAFYVVVAAGYLASFVLLARVLRLGMPLGVAYGIWAALGVSATALLSALLFAEALTPTMLLGLALIIAGVLVVELASERARAHAAAGAR